MNEPKLYEIINPSDPYTLEASDFMAACVATCLLGNGNYALQEVGGEGSMPPFIFGGRGEWFTEQFGMDFKSCATAVSNITIAEIMDSVLIGSPHNRKVYEAGLLLVDADKRDKFKEIYLDGKRSSINNIGNAAAQWAERLRQSVREEGEAVAMLLEGSANE